MRDLASVELTDFFKETDASIEDLLQLRAQAFRRTARRKEIEKVVREWPQTPTGKPRFARAEDRLRLGVAQWILGRTRDAADLLGEARDLPAGTYFWARVQLELNRLGDALEALRTLAGRQKRSLDVRLALLEALARAGNVEDIRTAADAAAADFPESADAIAYQGVVLDLDGEHEAAVAAWTRALEKDPQCGLAAFRLAFALDLRGNDEEALALYQRCARLRPPPAHALINMGVLYEDRAGPGDLERAIDCYKSVLRTYPNHLRAQLFLKDAVASLDQFYDEEQGRAEDRRTQLLKTPVTDFELSVRSRNCLAKMNIRSLGDLIQKTEPELLAYKNFGETSLAEIKALLESKGLRLGMAKEEEELRKQRESLLQITPEDEKALLYERSVIELDLSLRARKAMESLGIKTIGDLVKRSQTELTGVKNFGETSLKEVKTRLAALGLSLKE